MGCSRIKNLSARHTEGVVLRPDWAIIKLEHPINRNIPNQATSSKGFEHTKRFKSYPVYYSGNRIDTSKGYGESHVQSLIKPVHCDARMDSFASEVFRHPKDPLFVLQCDQEVIQGNSGSGVFNDEGDLEGVISFAFPSGETIEHLGENITVTNNFAGGTSIHCISELNQNPDRTCIYKEDDLLARPFSRLTNIHSNLTISEQEKNRFEEIKNLKPDFVWETHRYSVYQEMSAQERIREDMSDTFLREHFDYLVEQSAKQTMPLTIKCIPASYKNSQTIEWDWPIYHIVYKDFNLLETGLYYLPAEATSLRLQSNYTATSNSFKTRFLRINEEDRSTVNNSFSNLLSALTGVLSLDDRQRRAEFTQGTRDYESFFNSGEYPKSLLENELLLMDTNSDPEFDIPVCP